MKIYDFNGKKAPALTQEQLAAKLQLAGIILERDSISRIEIGTRFVADFELAALCGILGVTSAYLLGLED